MLLDDLSIFLWKNSSQLSLNMEFIVTLTLLWVSFTLPSFKTVNIGFSTANEAVIILTMFSHNTSELLPLIFKVKLKPFFACKKVKKYSLLIWSLKISIGSSDSTIFLFGCSMQKKIYLQYDTWEIEA